MLKKLTFFVALATLSGCQHLHHGGALPSPEPPWARTPDASFRAAPPTAADSTILRVPEILVEQLPSGMKVILAQRADLPMATVAYTSRAAYDDGTLASLGLAGLTASALAWDHDRLRAHASPAGTTLYSTVLATGVLSEISRQARAVLSPSLPNDLIETVKQRRQDSLTRKQRWLDLDRGTRTQLYGADHPLTLGLAGTPNTVEAMTPQDVRRFHSQRFGPAHSALIVVGSVNPSEVFSAAKEAFGDWSHASQLPPESLPPVNPPAVQAAHAYDKDLPRAGFRFEVPCVGLLGNDTIGGELVATLFAGLGSTPAEVLRHELGANYWLDSGCVQTRHHGELWVSGESEVEQVAKTLGTFVEQVRELSKFKLSDEQLAKAKAKYLGEVAATLSTNKGLMFAIRDVFIYDWPADHLAQFEATVNGLTPEYIQDLVKRTIGSGRWGIVVYGPRRQLEPQLGWLGEVVWH